MEIAQWLDVAGNEKAASIISLAPQNVRSVVEIGCGTGAVLEALDRRGFAERYWACEPQPELFAQIATSKISRLIAASQATFDQAFGNQCFDLAILTHVVEHLLTPAEVVTQALRRARHVFIEIPIEDNPAGWTRAHVRKLLGHDRRDNAAGHVQFFSRHSARKLIEFAGGTILAERGYFPYDSAAASADRLHKKVVLQLATHEAVGRVYYEHYAMLAQLATIDNWGHHYHKPI